MAVLTSPSYYNNGGAASSTVIGYESSHNRVVRFSFTTGSSGATKIDISVVAGTISKQNGADQTSIPFYVGTSSTSHTNANAAQGSAVTGYITGSSGKAYSGSANVVLKADTTYYLWFFPNSTTYGWSYWHSTSYYTTSCTTSGTSKFTLSISAGTGSSISVNRTSSPVGAGTGALSNNAAIYKNDKLKITFTPSTNYAIKTRTVNGTTFTSGNTHTVSGNVSVVSTAQVLASDVGATNANIGSNSTITVTKYNDSYYHTLQYSFGSLSGYITSSGGTSSSASKFTNASVSFKIPDTFYAQIPNAKTGTCTITCKTYSSSSSTTQLGNSTTDTFTVTASSSLCKPTVSGTVEDTNATTIALTGNPATLIKHKSTAKCTVTATPKNSATISSVSIDSVAVTKTASGSASIGTKTYTNVSATSFDFGATDSRGYTNSATVSPSVVNYTVLTCVPTIYRPTPTGSDINMDVSGQFYRGSFGAYSNTLTLTYRYKETGGVYGDWITIPSSSIVLGTSSFSSSISLGNEFDYHKSYVFQVKAVDGTAAYPLTTVTKTIDVSRGIPVYDWGENDFNFNVPVMLNNVNILNIMYPVGSVYMHSSSTLPTVISGVGTWSSVTTGISGVYAWKRTA